MEGGRGEDTSILSLCGNSCAYMNGPSTWHVVLFLFFVSFRFSRSSSFFFPFFLLFFSFLFSHSCKRICRTDWRWLEFVSSRSRRKLLTRRSWVGLRRETYECSFSLSLLSLYICPLPPLSHAIRALDRAHSIFRTSKFTRIERWRRDVGEIRHFVFPFSFFFFFSLFFIFSCFFIRWNTARAQVSALTHAHARTGSSRTATRGTLW